jgi:hypothetical protein
MYLEFNEYDRKQLVEIGGIGGAALGVAEAVRFDLFGLRPSASGVIVAGGGGGGGSSSSSSSSSSSRYPYLLTLTCSSLSPLATHFTPSSTLPKLN